MLSKVKDSKVTVERIIEVSSRLFMQRGYENTTIDDIVEELGDLSKGAIYHHFKSKEEIILAVSRKVNQELLHRFHKTISGKKFTGMEKAKQFLMFILNEFKNHGNCECSSNLLNNPKVLALHLQSSIFEIAPNIIQPFMEEGVKDGSIKTDYPKQLSEVIALMTGIWMNPFIFRSTKEEINDKYMFFKKMMAGYGMDFFDEEFLNHIYKLLDNNKI